MTCRQLQISNSFKIDGGPGKMYLEVKKVGKLAKCCQN